MRKEKNCNRCNKVKHYSFTSIEALRKISNFFINLKNQNVKKDWILQDKRPSMYPIVILGSFNGPLYLVFDFK